MFRSLCVSMWVLCFMGGNPLFAEETAEILTEPAEATEVQSETPELKSAPLTYEKPRILLMDLKGKHLTPESRESIYDLLATHLSAHEDFDVITSQDLRQMATLEADKQKAGCEDESCIAEMAGAMGARYVVYGNVGVLGKKNMLTLNLFDSVDAKPMGRKQVSVVELDELVEKVPRAVAELLEDKQFRTDRLKEADLVPETEFPWLPVSTATAVAAASAGVAVGLGLAPLMSVATDANANSPKGSGNDLIVINPVDEDTAVPETGFAETSETQAGMEIDPMWWLVGGGALLTAAIVYAIWVTTDLEEVTPAKDDASFIYSGKKAQNQEISSPPAPETETPAPAEEPVSQEEAPAEAEAPDAPEETKP